MGLMRAFLPGQGPQKAGMRRLGGACAQKEMFNIVTSFSSSGLELEFWVSSQT